MAARKKKQVGGTYTLVVNSHQGSDDRLYAGEVPASSIVRQAGDGGKCWECNQPIPGTKNDPLVAQGGKELGRVCNVGEIGLILPDGAYKVVVTPIQL